MLLLCLGGTAWYIWFRPGSTPGAGDATPTPTATSQVTTPPATTEPAAPPPTATATATATPAPTETASPTETEPATIDVPNVVGKTGAQADKILRDAGFTKITFVSGDDPSDPVQILGEWKVTEQSPAAGEKVAPDTEIVLTVTKLGGGLG